MTARGEVISRMSWSACQLLTILYLPDTGFDVIERQVGDLVFERVEVHDCKLYLRCGGKDRRLVVVMEGRIGSEVVLNIAIWRCDAQ